LTDYRVILNAAARLVLALIVFASVYALADTCLMLAADWVRRPVSAYGGSDRRALGDVLLIFTAIATLSNAAAWTYRLEIVRITPFRTVTIVQALAALLTATVQAGAGAVLGVLAMAMGPLIAVGGVLWMFLVPALITWAVFWFVAGRRYHDEGFAA
jgi:hypothetical protein